MTLLENVYTTAHIFDDIVIARDITHIIVGGRHTRRVRELLSSLTENSPRYTRWSDRVTNMMAMSRSTSRHL